MAKTKRKGTSAFTLVELMIVVAIIGVLAAVAIPAFSKYIRKSREPESSQLLNKMWLGSISYYTVDHIDVNSISQPKQFPGANVTETTYTTGNAYCGCFSSRKCPGGGAFWKSDPIFRALNLVQADAHEFIATYSGSGTGTGALFTAEAVGDLDCDTTYSRYRRNGSIDPAQGDVKGQVAPYVLNPGE